MELGQGLHEKDVWSEFGHPASKQSKVIASTVFVPFFCSVTLITRSRSLIIELQRGLHERHVWCEFGDPASKLSKVIANTVFCDGRTNSISMFPAGAMGDNKLSMIDG